jgi:phosphate starvation-inducible protein PhoH
MNKRNTESKDKNSEPAAVNKDFSPYVFQRNKINFKIQLKDLPWSEKQKKFISLAADKNTKIMLVNGPAGTSKTLLSVYASLKLLNEKRISDVIYLRSAVESSSSKLGFLPGSAEEKLAFYNLPFWDKVQELLPALDGKKLKDDQRIHAFPINYIRGLNWNLKSIILDEAQNSTYKELVTAMTRLGHFSRMFILADPMQSDLINGQSGGFEKLFNLFENDIEAESRGIFTFKFDQDDVKRSELVSYLVKRLSQPAQPVVLPKEHKMFL